MKVEVKITKSFKKQAKPLLKKYKSLADELIQLSDELKENPKRGTDLGNDTYKIRLAVKSKNRGKSGGLRIISHLQGEIIGAVKIEDNNLVVYLISIYDKSETASISDNELKELIEGIEEA